MLISKLREQINKSKSLLIILEDEKELVVLTTININTQTQNNNNPFQPYQKIELRSIPTFFLVSTDVNTSIYKSFKTKTYPILDLSDYAKKNISKKEIASILEAFIRDLK